MWKLIESFVKESRSIADIIYFDVANTFDSVSHQRLLDKFELYDYFKLDSISLQ